MLAEFPSLLTTDFSLDRAVLLARMSELAYESHPGVIAEQLDLPSVTAFAPEGISTQGFWFVQDGTAVLVFRGSSQKEHWWNNLKVSPTATGEHPWGWVHGGFFRSLESVMDSVLTPFADASSRASTMWLAGHSLGGALAVLASAWLHQHGGGRIGVHTYGQPMPGFLDFADRYDQELPGCLTRFINQSDIVPRLPGIGYKHCGLPKKITSQGRLETLRGSMEPPQLIDEDVSPASSAELDAFIAELEASSEDDFSNVRLEGLITSRIPWMAHHDKSLYVRELTAIRDASR